MCIHTGRLDGFQCVLTENKRRKCVLHPEKGSRLVPTNRAIDSRVVRPRVASFDKESERPASLDLRSSSREPRPGRESSLNYAAQTADWNRPTEAPALTVSTGTVQKHTRKESVTQSDASQESFSPSGPLPAYIQPLPTNLDDEDLAYLSKKGALSMPSTSFRNVCLCRYIEFVQPVLPLLDLNETLAIISHSRADRGTISLLLFNAVMYAALAFVETKHIRRAGYTSKLAARTSFYTKAKVRHSLRNPIDPADRRSS